MVYSDSMKLHVAVSIGFDDRERSILRGVTTACKPSWLFSEVESEYQKTARRMTTERVWNLTQLYDAWAFLKQLVAHYEAELEELSQNQAQVLQSYRILQLNRIYEARELLSTAIVLLDPGVSDEALEEDFPRLGNLTGCAQ